MSSYRYADIPEGEGNRVEGCEGLTLVIVRKPLAGSADDDSSETWTWLHSPAFRATPLDMKAEADLHFIQGINQIIGHGWPVHAGDRRTAPDGIYTQLRVFNDNNPWWPVMPDLARYLQRVSFLLRQGKPANDVALYLPTDDAWAQFTNGRTHTQSEQLGDMLGTRNLIPQILECRLQLRFLR